MTKRNNKTKQSIELEKYKEIYNLSKEVFDKELRRSEIIDEKASKYLTALTLFLGIFAFFAERLINSNLSPYHCLDLIQIIICVILLLLLFATCIFVFSALKIRGLKRISLNTDDSLKPTMSELYYGLSKKIEDNFKENRDVIDYKARRLQTAYILTLITVIFLVILSILFIFRSLKLQINNDNKAPNISTFDKSKNIKYPEYQSLEKSPIEETLEDRLNPNITPPLFNLSTNDSNLPNQN